MKKILIVQNSILHYRVPLYRMLSSYYDVTVLHSGDKQWLDEPFSEIKISAKKIGPFYLQHQMLQEVNKKQYSAIILMFDLRWINNILTIFISRSPLVLWGHRYSSNKYANKFRNYLMKKVDSILLYDDSEIGRMLESGINPKKIFVANNTIDVPNFSIDKSTKKNSFLFVGRAQKRKKVDELITSFNLIYSDLPNGISVDIIGDGAENEKLKALVKKLNIEDRVHFHGTITDPEKLIKFFHRALAYVSPGPVGLGVLHSFAYGVPVVTLKNEKHGPEFNHLVDGKNSIIYDSSDELAEILLRLGLSDQSKRLGQNSFDLFKSNLRIENMVNGFVDAIGAAEILNR